MYFLQKTNYFLKSILTCLTWATSYHYYIKYPVRYQVPSKSVGSMSERKVVKSEMKQILNVYLLFPFVTSHLSKGPSTILGTKVLGRNSVLSNACLVAFLGAKLEHLLLLCKILDLNTKHSVFYKCLLQFVAGLL